MRFEDIFTPDELAAGYRELESRRDGGHYQPGRWMVSALNHTVADGAPSMPDRVVLRDITLRTTEQMPAVINSEDERLEMLRGLAAAGVPSIVPSAFRRGHSRETMRRQVELVRSINPSCEVLYGNVVRREEMEMAVEAGLDSVQVWSAVFLGDAMPMCAGAVYHRVATGRDWRDLRFPESASQHMDRSERLVAMAVEFGLRVSASVNVLAYADLTYVEEYSARMRDAGAYSVVLCDSSGGVGPEALAAYVGAAKQAAPELTIGVHAHNLFGMSIAASIAAVRAGAGIVEVSVNGYEVGPGGAQAPLAGMALALAALYDVDTGIDLSAMSGLAALVEDKVGWPVAWNEPGLGRANLISANADEYEMESRFDPLIHASVLPGALGADKELGIGWTTGPFALQHYLRTRGIEVELSEARALLQPCKEQMAAVRRQLTVEELLELRSRAAGLR